MSEQKNREEKKQFKISGMTCVNCALTIEKGLKKMPGVKTVAVNFASEKLTVEVDSNVVKEGDLLAKIKDLGYG
ncbi:MAG: heavy metal-associated domain-containing protein, partial [Desulfitobacteriaceae bacterium]